MSHGARCSCEACERGRSEGLAPETYASMAEGYWKLAAILEPLSIADRFALLQKLGEAFDCADELNPLIAAARKRVLD